MVFTPFPKIPRLNREIVITEKIDGTNASIFVPEDGPLMAASRTRWITPQNDNAGFARWVAENEERLREGLGPGHHFGEWWGAGIQRRYGILEKRFSLFNVKKWNDGPPDLCHVVPVLYRGPWSLDAVANAVDELRRVGSAASPGFMLPEGVVVYHTASGALFKVTLEKDESPKGCAACKLAEERNKGRLTP